MRIISGKYRGKKLKEFDLSTTKPTLDRVKESIFNLIQFDILDSDVLDLFAGTGALGIECISRGARKTILVDNNSQAIKIINENLKGMDGDYEVKNMDYLTYLQSTRECFDIVLLDPPYATDLGKLAIDYLIKNDRINSGGIIIFETSDDFDFGFNYPNYDIKRKKYGTVAVYKFTKLD